LLRHKGRHDIPPLFVILQIGKVSARELKISIPLLIQKASAAC